MTVPERLNVVVLGVRDLAVQREFYASLGWRLRPRQGMFSRLDLGGTSLMLFPLDTLEEVTGLTAPAAGEFRGTVNAIVAETDEQAESALSAAEAAGGSRLADLQDRAWGVRTGYFADPELNVWEVVVLPGAGFDDRGSLIWPGRPAS